MGEGASSHATLTGAQKQLLSQLAAFVGPQIGQGVQAYSGQIAPSATPLQRQGFDLAANYGTAGRTGAIDSILSGRPGYDVAGPEQYQSYYANAVEAPAMEQFRNETMREIANKYGTSGAGQAMAGDAGRRLAVDLASQKAQLGVRGLEQQQQALEAAAGRRVQGVALGQAEQGGAIDAALKAGETQYGILGKQGAEAYQKWQMSQPWANPYVRGFGQMALGTQAFTATPGSGKF